MPVRYSGDCVVRLRWDEDSQEYIGSVTEGRFRWRGRTGSMSVWFSNPTSSSSYDHAARNLIERAQKRRRGLSVEHDGSGRLMIRRVFECPCPGHELKGGAKRRGEW